MELEDASGSAHVRMHGHTFFVPKTAPGHLARVQATLVKKPAGGADDCEEGKASAKVELDATGVEIDWPRRRLRRIERSRRIAARPLAQSA